MLGSKRVAGRNPFSIALVLRLTCEPAPVPRVLLLPPSRPAIPDEEEIFIQNFLQLADAALRPTPPARNKS
jgi:hypothetical protein